jgi:glycosyltransferase involved in cell wall biosynthesis
VLLQAEAIAVQKYNVSIIIPAFNEEELLEAAVEKVLKWALQNLKSFEIIIVENGSTDTTANISDRLAGKYSGVVVLHLPEASIGKAIKAGMQRAKLESIVVLDADWIDLDFMAKSLKSLEEGDIVVGSKMLNPASDHRPFFRKVLSWMLTMFIRVVFRFRGSDSHGLNAFRAQSVKPIMEECQMSEIIKTELLLRAQRKGLKIIEFPASIKELRAPRLSVIKRCFMVSRELWQLSRVLRDIRRANEVNRVAR